MSKPPILLCSACVVLLGTSSSSAALAFAYDSGAQTLTITGTGQGNAVAGGSLFSFIAEWYEGSTINAEQSGAGDLGLVPISAGFDSLPASSQVSLRFYRGTTSGPVDGFQFFFGGSSAAAGPITFTGNGIPISLAQIDPLILAALEDAQTPGGIFGTEFNVVDSDSGVGSDIDGGFTQVPEPSTSLLGAIAAGFLLRRRR